jgi:hypothetical protein
MKKQILLATAAVLVSGSVFATKARMQALGQDTDGSWIMNDTRNVFYNAADLNGMKDYVVLETGAASNSADGETAPHAEGGFFKSMGDMTYGVYFGRDADLNTVRKNAGTGTATSTPAIYGALGGAGVLNVATGDAKMLGTGNNLDLFVAGDMGVEWGARLSYAKNKDEGADLNGTFGETAAAGIDRKQSALGLGLGAKMGDIEGYANLDLSDKSEGATVANDKWEADLGLDLGVDYNMNGNTFRVRYQKNGFEYTNAGVLTSTGEDSTIVVGLGRMMEVSSTSRWFYSAEYVTRKVELKANVAATNSELKFTGIPLRVGFESDATSWLTLRGSISQSVMGNYETTVTGSTNNGKVYRNTNTANVNLGATLNFGKIMVDGVIGTDGETGSTAALTNNNELGSLRLDRLMTRVAVHYWF